MMSQPLKTCYEESTLTYEKSTVRSLKAPKTSDGALQNRRGKEMVALLNFHVFFGETWEIDKKWTLSASIFC